MAQWLGAHAAVAEDPGSGPSFYICQLTPAFNSSSRGTYILLVPVGT